MGDDGATNHHCQHRHGHQHQTAVAWDVDELERNPKKGKSSKYNFQDVGHRVSFQVVFNDCDQTDANSHYLMLFIVFHKSEFSNVSPRVLVTNDHDHDDLATMIP